MKGAAAEKGFHPVDYIIFSLVLVVSLAIGLFHAFSGGRQKTTQEYFMANHKLRTIPVSLSILVSFVSAILVLGTPAEMYTRGTQLTMRVIGYCLACALSSLLFVPLFYSLKVTSSFEFLERRFQRKEVKMLGSVMMLLGNVFYMGLIMYTPSTALEAVTGFPFWMSILATGVVSTLYTTLGGMRAVIWTDVFQALVMITGMCVIVIAGTLHTGGMTKVFKLSQEGGRLVFFNFDPDPTERLSIWSLVIGGMFSTLTIFGIGQASVQRYCALPNVKQAQRSVYLNIPGLIIVNVLASLVGLVVFSYYSQTGCDPLTEGYISNSNQIVPYFVIDVLNYPGFPGIFIAVLFSGALSSMSSVLNSAAAVTWEDLVKPLCRDVKEYRHTLITKCIVIIYGCVSVFVAFLTNNIGMHVLQASLSLTGATTGPSLGMFILGAFFKSANALGAVVGCIVSLIFSLWLAIGTFINRRYSSPPAPSFAQYCDSNNNTYTTNMLNSSVTLFSNTAVNESFPRIYPVYSSIDNSANTSITADSLSGLDRFYRISFLWYSTFGCVICVTIGLVVSYLTKSMVKNDFDPDLIIPVLSRLCCDWPKILKTKWQKVDPKHTQQVLFGPEDTKKNAVEKCFIPSDSNFSCKDTEVESAMTAITACDNGKSDLYLNPGENSKAELLHTQL